MEDEPAQDEAKDEKMVNTLVDHNDDDEEVPNKYPVRRLILMLNSLPLYCRTRINQWTKTVMNIAGL